MMAIQAVLFDLDGTLIDTAPDLAAALNRLLAEHGRAPLPFERVRPIVSNGSSALVELGFGIARADPRFEPLRKRYLELYAEGLVRESRPFPGIPEVLDALAARGVRWGVVTNKPAFLTDPLLDALGLSARAACIVSGDTTENRKPHPEPMLHACRLAGTDPAHCLYVGDARRDIEAGERAGMKTLVALYGYIESHLRPEAWGADGMIERPGEILEWLDGATMPALQRG